MCEEWSKKKEKQPKHIIHTLSNILILPVMSFDSLLSKRFQQQGINIGFSD
jgi:hypothetical protein